jgi:hypothetical protein
MRELFAMAEQRARHDWRLFSSLMATIHNRTLFSTRDKAARPSDYDPFCRRASGDIPLTADEFTDMLQARYGSHKRG